MFANAPVWSQPSGENDNHSCRPGPGGAGTGGTSSLALVGRDVDDHVGQGRDLEQSWNITVAAQVVMSGQSHDHPERGCRLKSPDLVDILVEVGWLGWSSFERMRK